MSDRDRDRLRNVEELFAAAKELPRERRAAFLAGRCGGDEPLQAEVATLLDLEEGAGGFLERAADPWIGRRIDRWRLLERLGAGGMGVVYLAARDDGAYEQKVAIKLLKQGVEHDGLLERFRRERQVLAGLVHPHIARLIDGGATPENIPYFVMEHVDGTRLDRWCDERRLPLDRRLALFRDICAAVHYSHQNLVVHRDLKPGNVLVTDQGVVKLVDFGISKVIEPLRPDSRTQTFERRLTPEYASPEVVRGGPVTTASDVFSLGVVLYELLAGTRPWKAAEHSPTDLERAICETVPSRPSACAIQPAAAAARRHDPRGLRRALRGDLDAIVMTAIAAEPERRYASAEQMAADLEHHRAHEPIRARPPGAGYMLAKYVRRHRALVAAAVVALLALFAGGAGLLAGAAQARREAASTQRVNRLLQEMLVRLEPTSARGFAQSLLSQLHYANGELRSGLLRDDPDIEVDLRVALGRVYGALGYAGWARLQFELALAMERRMHGGRSARAALVMRWLGWALHHSAENERAVGHLRAAIALADEVGGMEQDARAALSDLGLALTGLGRFDEADAALQEALARLRGSDGDEARGAAGIHTGIALNLIARGDAAAAEPVARKALAMCEKLLPETDPRFAIALDTLARAHRARGEIDLAEPLLERSLEIRRELFDPRSPVLAWSLSLLAEVQVAAGRPSEAVPLLEEALAIRREHYDADSQPRMHSLLQLGLAQLDAGERAEALAHLREGVAIAARRGDEAEPMLRRAREEIARLRDALAAEE